MLYNTTINLPSIDFGRYSSQNENDNESHKDSISVFSVTLKLLITITPHSVDPINKKVVFIDLTYLPMAVHAPHRSQEIQFDR